MGFAGPERAAGRCHGDSPPGLLLVRDSPEHRSAHKPLRERRGDTLRPVVPHQLGRGDVPRADEHSRPRPHHHPQRGARTDSVHILRQDRHPHPEHHDLQQVLDCRPVLRRRHRRGHRRSCRPQRDQGESVASAETFFFAPRRILYGELALGPSRLYSVCSAFFTRSFGFLLHFSQDFCPRLRGAGSRATSIARMNC